MKKKLFEMGAKLDGDWSADNRDRPTKSVKRRSTLAPSSHRLYLRKERRRGKWVTIAGPFSLERSEQQALLKRLKRRLGCGGTLRDDTLEFQGDLSTALKSALIDEGFRCRN